MNKKNTYIKISNSRRSLLKKAALVIPAILTLTTRSTFAQSASFYGIQSGKQAASLDEVSFQCQGLTSNNWKMVYEGNGLGNGNPYQWQESGFSPSEMFAKHFNNPLIDKSWTLLDALVRGNELERGAVTALLNSSYFDWGADLTNNNISSADVVGLYNAYVDNESFYASQTGGPTIDNLQKINLANIFHS